MIPLGDLRDCMEGVMPSIIATCDAEGMPNVSYLSQVFYVDEAHVALSNQFFSKTTRNIQATGRASLILMDGRDGGHYALDLAFVESQSQGELYERMSAHLRALSAHHGLDKIMALRSADLYRVLDCRAAPRFEAALAEKPPGVPPGQRLAAAARLAADIAARTDAEAMIDGALDGLLAEFGFGNAMLLLPDASGARLVTLASRGYPTRGTGSEVEFGRGPIGIAAETRRPVRLCDLTRGRRMGEAARAMAHIDEARIIPLPGLANPLSQLAAPMISQGQMRGVLFVESPEFFAFTREDEDALALIGAQLAAGLRSAELEARAAASPLAEPVAPPPAAAPLRVKYFTHDDSLFLDDAYVIKGVPGRLLFHFLKAYAEEGRREFSNREIRLDRSLRLPDIKDNLEARLILLRRRLEERGAPVQLGRPERGRIRLELSAAPQLEIVD